MKIALGSENLVKFDAVSDAFRQMKRPLPLIVSFVVDSGVSRQPMSDNECIEGALSRAVKALELAPDADFAVGIESGLCRVSYGGGYWFERTWAVILDKNGKEGLGSSAGCFVPKFIVDRIKAEKSGLGEIMNERLSRDDVARKEGYVGVVTKHAITRRTVTRDAVINAFTIFLTPEYFKEGSGVGVGF